MFKKLKSVFKSYKEIFDMLAQHLELSIHAADIVVKEFAPNVDRFSVVRMAAEVMALEKRGDDVAAELTRVIGASSLPITMYGDLERLLDIVDDVLDDLYFMSQEIARARRLGLDANDVVKEVYQDLAAMSSVAKLAIERLRDLMKVAYIDSKKVVDLNREIDTLEDKVDEMRNSVLDKIYGNRDSLDHLSTYHLIELTRAIDRLVDACKDAAHLVVSMIRSIAG